MRANPDTNPLYDRGSKTKPFQSYPGGKEADGTYQNIINKIPPHEIFVNGCLGNCAIMRNKRPAPVRNIGIDLDPDVIANWAEFQQFSFFYYQEDIIEYLKYAIPDLLLEGKTIFIYLDPPYPASVRKQGKKKVYAFEMLEDEQHRALLAQVVKLAKAFPKRVFFMLSTYRNELYDSILTGWNSFDFKSKTRAGTAIKTIYFNYADPVELHDYSYLGTDFRERFRIKERVKRNVSRLKRMNPLERNAIIDAFKREPDLTTIK